MRIAFIILLFTFSCKKVSKTTNSDLPFTINQNIEYASGFTIQNHKTYTKIIVTTPWPDAKESLTYVLYPKGTKKPSVTSRALYIETPIKNLIVTSTTDIPMLEYLGLENHLIGFPNTHYISSVKTRSLIEKDSVIEVGKEYQLNTEVILDLSPDLIIGFSSNGDTKSYHLLEKAGIPVVINGSWAEKHPLGRTEWIKFVGAFFNKETEATAIFDNIKTEYINAKKLAKNANHSPTVMSGDLFKDIWYTPGGKSFMAQFLKDANTSYLWKNDMQTGSLSLNFESILEKAKNADLWIGSINSKSLASLKEKNHKYAFFDAYKNNNVYSSALKKGDTGGLIYYELGAMRPDLILKDIIHIAHPTILTNYEPYFFKKLN